MFKCKLLWSRNIIRNIVTSDVLKVLRGADGPIAQPRQTFGIELAKPPSDDNVALKKTARVGSSEDRPSHAAQATAQAIEEVDYDAWHATHGFQPGQVRCP